MPQKYESNTSLGAWVARQRLIMRQWDDDASRDYDLQRSGRSLLTAKRVEQLKSIGLESSIGKGAFGKLCYRNTNEWEKQFSNLLKYRDTHGDCKVPTKNTTLGRWVSSQRKQYRQFLTDNCRGSILGWSNELRNRFHRLANIGFNFHVGKGNAQQGKSNWT